MDLEMTGLEPTRDVIVEIAVLITDDELRIVAEGPDLVVSATAEQLEGMGHFVREMHTRSGLLDAIRSSTLSLEDAGQAVLAFLKEQIPEKRSVPLAGNSIGTDRRFLAAYLPEIEDWLHYRSIDVSTIKELCRRWYPEALAGAPDKRTTHRAMDDIKESVAELAYYRAAIFRAAGAAPSKEDPS
jgi:oligoribonuclease